MSSAEYHVDVQLCIHLTGMNRHVHAESFVVSRVGKHCRVIVILLEVPFLHAVAFVQKTFLQLFPVLFFVFCFVVVVVVVLLSKEKWEGRPRGRCPCHKLKKNVKHFVHKEQTVVINSNALQ